MKVFKSIVPLIAALGLIFLSISNIPEETDLHSGISISTEVNDIQSLPEPEAWWHRWWRHPWRWHPW